MGAPATSVPTAHEALVDQLAPAVRAVSAVASSNHTLSLQLSGALLLRGVPPEAVPAVVEATAQRAGWVFHDPAQHRRTAEWTVARWRDDEPFRSDVPVELVPTLDRVCAPPAPAASTVASELERLREALRAAREGLLVVRAPCGIGKTRACEDVASERAQAGQRTVISVPTHAVAVQVTRHLRERGVTVRRVFSPASLTASQLDLADPPAPPTPDPPICIYTASGRALAAGWQSVRWELCDGRGVDPCPARRTCPAAPGEDGPSDAPVVVGVHAMLGELSRVCGRTGLLLIDEPPRTIEDWLLTRADLLTARDRSRDFDRPDRWDPIVSLALAWLDEAPLDETTHLATARPTVPGLGHQLQRCGALTVADAAASAIERGRAPAISGPAARAAREDPARARQLGDASRTLGVLHRALTDPVARTTVYEPHASPGERRLAVNAIERQLCEALRVEGRAVVVLAADADLHREQYRRVCGYTPAYLALHAVDGVPVRRALIRTRIPRRRPPGPHTIRRAVELCGVQDASRLCVVTHRAWLPRVRSAVPESAATGHFGALRGLDTWREYEGLITIGDPIPNLHSVARAWIHEDPTEQAQRMARAELEQAHGRLRTVHRTTPCVQVHVGSVVPGGWPEGVEVHSVPRGRPRVHERPPIWEIVATVQEHGQRGAAQRYGVTRGALLRWLDGLTVRRAKQKPQ